MPKTIKLKPHLDATELESRYRKARDPVLRSHYQILWLLSSGETTTRVMEVTGYSRGWIQQLARRYNSDGARALGDGRHGNPGAKDRALLSVDQQEELREALEKLHSTIPLDEARIIEIIEEIRDLTSETGSPFLPNEKGLLARVPQHKRFLPSAAA